jgi:hypothetical protein
MTMESAPPRSSTSKKVMTLVWVLGLVLLAVCFFSALAGPKIGTLFGASAKALSGDGDAGR